MDKLIGNKIGFAFEAGYNREGLIVVEKAICDGCRECNPCLSIDSSHGEYGAGYVCQPCVEGLFQRYKAATC